MNATATFSIAHLRLLDAQGAPLGPLPEWVSRAAVEPLYRAMVRTRAFDQKAVALQRTGRMGTYAPAIGHEAVGVGVASAMATEDVFLPYYRDYAVQFWRGVRMDEILRYWGGDERSMCFEACPRDFPLCVPIGTQCTQAAGVAYALKLRGERAAAVVSLGDGATSKGDFYEAVNAAGVLRLPLVFVVTNNRWAISVPLEQQTCCATLAQKAIAGGIRGIQVDGNDVLAVRTVMDEALQLARSQGVASVVEAITFRLGDHTTADDATRYRDPAVVARHWAEEPLARTRAWLASHGWSKQDEEVLIRASQAEVQAAVDAYLAAPPPDPGQMFRHLHAELPASLEVQRDEALRDASPVGEEVGHA